MPVASIARLFKRSNGKQGVAVKAAPSSLDVAASRTGNRIYLHGANLEYGRSLEASFAVAGMRAAGGRVSAIAPEDPREYVNQDQRDVFRPVETVLSEWKWRFPARAVAVVELECG